MVGTAQRRLWRDYARYKFSIYFSNSDEKNEIVIASVSEAIQLWRRGEKAGLLRRKGSSQ
jgi:hypothetical protein